ncbi:hypothetical protein GW17_00026973 [Ensete ventricosum]|nr:hypothetical protein GW17_00026973 [Ensete ventricosum]
MEKAHAHIVSQLTTPVVLTPPRTLAFDSPATRFAAPMVYDPMTSPSRQRHSSSTSGRTRCRGCGSGSGAGWVSEIRLPNSRDRIWVGSYDSPEKAARAFDAAAVCLRGPRARLNFPDSPPPCVTRPLSPQHIQAAAARHAATPPSQPRGAPTAGEAGSAEALYWSFMDPQQAAASEERTEFPAAMDDYFSPAPPADVVEDHGAVDFGSNSFLWSF